MTTSTKTSPKEPSAPAARLEQQRPSRLVVHSLLVCLIILGCSDPSASRVPTQAKEKASTPPTATADRAGSLAVTYLANEGFLLAAGDSSVLIDALFGDGLDGYRTVPHPIREDLENGVGRFAGVDCILATHEHADHFNPHSVAGLLDRVPAQFVSTRAAVEQVSPLLTSGQHPEPRWLRPARHQIEKIDCGGVSVSAMSFHHGRLMVKNLAYLVDLGGLTVLHVGDTEITEEEIRPWGLADLDIDIALLPSWHLTEPRWLPVIEEIGSPRIVAMHLASADAPASWFGSAGSLEKRIAEIRRQNPDAWIPTEAMEERVFEARE
jgi:L-ascorbate metabolism protein UlaG (beta-lactamase superfamily)